MMGVGKNFPTTLFGCVSVSTKSPNITSRSRPPLFINRSIISPIPLLPVSTSSSSSRGCQSDFSLEHIQKHTHKSATLCHFNTKISSEFRKMATPVEAKIAPSMLSSDFANLASEAERMVNFGADWLHMDIMDGHFVPNLTIGAPVIGSLRKHTKAYLDCHLMVTNPLDYVNDFGKAGASGFTFHVEVSKDNWQELVKEIKSKGMRPGVALKPGTPVEEVYPLVEGENPVEMVLVMTVEPGFGGQKFMSDMMTKVFKLRQKYPTLDIEVDGGLGPSTIEAAAAAGANCIVAGSSVFGAPEPAQVISLLRTAVNNANKTA